MSYRVVEWVMQQSVPNAACKLLLMVIGTHADDAGRCFPRVRVLAREATLSVRTTHRVLARLADEYGNLIEWERQNGASNVYQLMCPIFGDPGAKGRPPILDTYATTVAQPLHDARKSRPLSYPPVPTGGRTENHHLNHHSPKGIVRSAEPRARRLPKRDRGEIEIALAEKIGPTVADGIDVLSYLSAAAIDQLCAQERTGSLTELDVQRVRSQYVMDAWKRRREKFHQAHTELSRRIDEMDK
jgi:hypothetical protein